jgi:heme-degrading monooxygenase HmoA
MSESNILAVVEGFTHWSKLWCFLEAVLTHGDLSDADRIVIRGIWADTCSAVHWEQRSLFDGTEAASRALKKMHPWLSLLARTHFVRAAAYEWK